MWAWPPFCKSRHDLNRLKYLRIFFSFFFRKFESLLGNSALSLFSKAFFRALTIEQKIIVLFYEHMCEVTCSRYFFSTSKGGCYFFSTSSSEFVLFYEYICIGLVRTFLRIRATVRTFQFFSRSTSSSTTDHGHADADALFCSHLDSSHAPKIRKTRTKIF